MKHIWEARYEFPGLPGETPYAPWIESTSPERALKIGNRMARVHAREIGAQRKARLIQLRCVGSVDAVR